jgi:hypothetical protein
MSLSVTYFDEATGKMSDPVELVTKTSMDKMVTKTAFDEAVGSLNEQLADVTKQMVEMLGQISDVAGSALKVSQQHLFFHIPMVLLPRVAHLGSARFGFLKLYGHGHRAMSQQPHPPPVRALIFPSPSLPSSADRTSCRGVPHSERCSSHVWCH